MPLRFDLGPFDELYIGTCVLKNSHEHSLFVIEGEMPILQGKDVLSEQRLRSPLERLYHCVQQMYLESAPEKYQGKYLQFAAQSVTEDPGLHDALRAADDLIRKRELYKALKGLKKLIPPEAFEVDRRPRPSANYSPRVNGWKPQARQSR
jgi:flagellar protein FlbT